MSDKQYITELEKTNERLTKEKDELAKEVQLLEDKISILSNRLQTVEFQLYHDQRAKEKERKRQLEQIQQYPQPTITTNHTGAFLPNRVNYHE